MNKEINFILERYRSGGSNRYTCPQCGRKKCFTRYIDVRTNEYVAEDCGKCNHESSCGYHYPPRDYFHDHPDMQVKSDWDWRSADGSRTVLSHAKLLPAYVPREIVQTEFFDISWAEQAAKRPSTFRTWFESLPFDKERIQEVLTEYYVGGTEKDILFCGNNHGPAAVFWMIDEQGRVHDAKLIAYHADGHRVQGWGNSMRAICEKQKSGPQLSETEKVLFGLHLLNRYPQKTVCIVESEKSALVCACQYPEYLWLATGGCGNLQASKLLPLMNRNLVIYPDSGEYQKWCERMKESGHKHYHVVDFMESYEPNTDIADLILGHLTISPITTSPLTP